MRILVRVDSFQFLHCSRQENAGIKWYQNVIWLVQRQHEGLPRLETVSSPSLLEFIQKASNTLHTSSLCKLMTVSQMAINMTNYLELFRAI